MNVFIAGGGTGGHLFPGIALAEEFERRDPENVCIFIGTKQGLEAKIALKEGFELRCIDIKGLKGKSFREKVYNLFFIPKGIYQSGLLIKEWQPKLVIGMGGYVSATAIVAAVFMRVKTAICEQNAIPGMANRILARFANRIFISFEETKCFSSKKRARFTGNPIRKSVIGDSLHDKIHTGKFTLAVLGGSRGAHSINEKMLDALDYLIPIIDSLKVIHQTGENDHQWVYETYRKKGFDAEVLGFIDDMARVYKTADLVISRAGAGTISELACHGKASILIPYPFAADNHQEINARILVNKGAAKMILNKEVLGKNLAEMILDLAADPDTLSQMREEASRFGRPRASEDIVDSCYELLGMNELCQKDGQKSPNRRGEDLFNV